jgi:hypothetical protein
VTDPVREAAERVARELGEWYGATLADHGDGLDQTKVASFQAGSFTGYLRGHADAQADYEQQASDLCTEVNAELDRAHLAEVAARKRVVELEGLLRELKANEDSDGDDGILPWGLSVRIAAALKEPTR